MCLSNALTADFPRNWMIPKRGQAVMIFIKTIKFKLLSLRFDVCEMALSTNQIVAERISANQRTSFQHQFANSLEIKIWNKILTNFRHRNWNRILSFSVLKVVNFCQSIFTVRQSKFFKDFLNDLKDQVRDPKSLETTVKLKGLYLNDLKEFCGLNRFKTKPNIEYQVPYSGYHIY